MSKKVEIPEDEYECVLAMLETHLAIHRYELLEIFAKVVVKEVRKVIWENTVIGDWCAECVKQDDDYASGHHLCQHTAAGVFNSKLNAVRDKLDKEELLDEYRDRMAKAQVHRRSIASLAGRSFDDIFAEAHNEIMSLLIRHYKGPVNSGFGTDILTAYDLFGSTSDISDDC